MQFPFRTLFCALAITTFVSAQDNTTDITTEAVSLLKSKNISFLNEIVIFSPQPLRVGKILPLSPGNALELGRFPTRLVSLDEMEWLIAEDRLSIPESS